MALSQPDPADACRQTLESDLFLRHIQPMVKMLVFGNQLLHLRVRSRDVFWVPGQRGPTKRSDATAKEWTNVGRHEAREIESVRAAHILCHLADVVAVVQHRNAIAPEREHGLD